MQTIDNFYADSGKEFGLSINKVVNNEFENIRSGDISGNNKDIVTVIYDDSKVNSGGTYPNPNDPNDGAIEVNQESVILKIVAANEDGNPLKDVDGNYKVVNEVVEGENAYYIVLAFRPTSTEFNDSTKIDKQGGNVTIKTSDDTAKGVDTQTIKDGTQDYINKETIVTVGEVFGVKTLNDWIKDPDEKYSVEIVNNSYTHPVLPLYENVTTNLEKVITTINDNDVSGHIDIKIALITIPTNEKDQYIDSDGSVKLDKITDGNGKLIVTNTNTTAEGDKLYYVAVAIDSDGKVINIQDGTLKVSTGDKTATGGKSLVPPIDGSEDYVVLDKVEVTIGKAFEVQTNDDYLSDNNEEFIVKIVEIVATPYENTTIDGANSSVVSVITDNPAKVNEPDTGTGNDDLINGSYGSEDSVYAIITGSTIVNEGDKVEYTVKLVDKDGNIVTPQKDTEVTVTYTNVDTLDGDTNKIDNEEIKVTIKANESEATFEVGTIDDYYAEGDEDYKVEITDVANTGEFENIKYDSYPSSIPNNPSNSVVTTIIDNPAQDTSNPQTPIEDGGYNEDDTVYVKIEGSESVLEGETITHKLTLVDKNNNLVTIPVGEKIIVSLEYSSTTGLDDSDFTTIIKEVELVSDGTSFTNITKIDNVYEGVEEYTVTIVDVKQIKNTYENVAIHSQSSTIGTITDNPVEIVLVATDKDGNIPLDGDGKVDLSKNTNITPEGGKLYYIAVAIDADGKPLDSSSQKGTVDVSYGLTPDNGTIDDYTIESGKENSVNVGEVFEVIANDDYYAEGNEDFIVTISNPSGAYSEATVSVKAGSDKVTSTIIDNPAKINEPDNSTGNDDPINGSYGSEDTVYAIIEGAQTIIEGELSTNYTVKLVDKSGTVVTPTKDTKITVTYNHYTDGKPTQNDDTEYKDGDTIEVTILANTSEITFKVQTNDDPYKDDGEQFNLTITDIDNTGEFENIKIGDINGNHKNVVSTIKDDTIANTETNPDPVSIVLVALNKGQTLADITNGDGELIYNSTNKAPEGGKLYYMAVAVDSSNKVLIQDGKVEVSTANISAVGGTSLIPPLDGSEDYKSFQNKEVGLGEVFEVETNDDYYAEGNETFTVKITSLVDTIYETPLINTSYDTVTSTITDNPANKDTSDPQTPIEPKDPNNPDGAKEYDENDTVYVVVTTPNTVTEGGELIHYLEILDKDGNKVDIPSGEIITVKLIYSSTGDVVDIDDFVTDGWTKEVVLDSTSIYEDAKGYKFTNKTEVDTKVEGSETYTVSIGQITQGVGKFENIEAGYSESYKTANPTIGEGKSVTGTITDEPAKIVLVAVTSLSTTIADITAVDGTLNYNSTNEAFEGDKLYYMAVAVNSKGEVLDQQLTSGAKVKVSTADNGAIGVEAASKIDGSEDYVKLDTNQEIEVGKVFSVQTIDDYKRDNDESFTVTIDSISNSGSYTSPTVDGTNKTVTSTIKDNTPTYNVTPTLDGIIDDGSLYGKEDTVWVQIIPSSTSEVIEGKSIEYIVKFVDKDGKIVKPTSATDVTIKFAGTTIDGACWDDIKDVLNSSSASIKPVSGDEFKITIPTSGSTTFTVVTKDDFVAEGTSNKEQFSLTITDVDKKGDFENLVWDDASKNTTTTTIKDGVTLGTPVDAIVYEDGLNDTANTTENSLLNSLGITNPNNDDYTVSFDKTITTCSKTSNGQTITYSYNAAGTLLTAKRTDGKTVFTVQLKKSSGKDVYDFKLLQPMDHEYGNNGKDSFDLPFEFNVTSDGVKSPNKTFNVTVVDSIPIAANIVETINEDGNITIRLSDDAFGDSGKIKINGTDVDEGSTIDIYENGATSGSAIGTLENKGDGTVIFTPKSNYSQYDKTNSPKFTYTITDFDGDEADGSVTIHVTPVADKPTFVTTPTPSVYEDTGAEILGIKIPQITDDTDQNSGIGDSSERLGAIEFSFSESSDFGTAQFGYMEGGTFHLLQNILKDSTFTIILNEAGYHVAGTTGIHTLTKAQYENIAIKHAEDNATNIKTTISVQSYEVKEDGSRVDGVDPSEKATQTVILDVKAVTDSIVDFEFDDSSSCSELVVDSSDPQKATYTIPAHTEEGKLEIDLKSLLKTQTLGDKDGSERRWYEIEGLAKGTVVTIGGKSATAGSDGKVTIEVSNTTNANPDFKIKYPPYYADTEDRSITIKLTVKDTDSDSPSANPLEVSETIILEVKGTITPVPQQATIQVAQAVGWEDQGRGGNATTQPKEDLLQTDYMNGIELDIKVTSDDDDGSETFKVKISEIPTGAAMVVYDQGNAKLVEIKGGEIYINDVKVPSDGGISVTIVGDKYYIEIADFMNVVNKTKPPLFIPPHNSHGDFPLKIETQTHDGSKTRDYDDNPNTTIKVIVKDVADSVVDNDLRTFSLTMADGSTNTYNAIVEEDQSGGICLDCLFVNTPKSYDSNSEDLSIVIDIAALPEGSKLTGAYKIIDDQYVFSTDKLDTIFIYPPKNYSGELEFPLTYITTEKGETANPSKTHDSEKSTPQNVIIFVKPTVDATFKTQTAHLEDEGDGVKVDGSKSYYKLNLGIDKNSDDDEELVSIVLDKPVGYKLFIIDGATKTEITDTYTLPSNEIDKVYVELNKNLSTNGIVIEGSYTVKDSKYNGVDVNYITTKTVDFTHTLKVESVTDTPELELGVINSEANPDIVGIAGTIVSIEHNNDISFKVPIQTNSEDKDGSENITKIVISGVPQGVTINGLGASTDEEFVSTSLHNGVYIIQAGSGYTLNDSVFKDIVFNVSDDANFEYRNINITVYTQDGANAKELSDTKTITLIKTYDGHAGTNPDVAKISLQSKDFTTTEDIEFNLQQIFTVVTDPIDSNGYDNNIELTIMVENGTLKGYMQNPDGSYTLRGNKADIEAVLSTIKVAPKTDHNNNFDGELKVTAIITGQETIHNEIPITPVTDEMSIDITPIGSTTIEENGEFKFNVTLSNNVDGDTTISDYYIKIDEKFDDSTETAIGDLYLGGTKLEYEIGKGYKLPVGTVVNLNDTLEFTYHSGKDRHGTVEITVSANNQEKYATNILLASATTKIIVEPKVTIDEYLDIAKVQDGVEDGTLAEVKISLKDGVDPSEEITSVILEKIPENVVVYVGDSKALAMNLGDGKWLIPITTYNTIPTLYFHGAQHYGGVIEYDILINVQDGNETYEKRIENQSINIIQVADGVEIKPTDSFGDAFSWIELKLNANMEDIDGSEVMNLKLSGLGETSQFKVGDIVFDGEGDNPNALWNEGDKSWTITGVKYDDINKIEFTNHKSVGKIDVEAWTQETDSNGNPLSGGNFESSIDSGDFKLDIKEVVGELKLDEGVNIDFTKLDDTSSLNNITKVDLSVSGKNELKLSLEDVLDITDNSNEIIIKGDSSDTLELDKSDDWTGGLQDGTTDTYIYTKEDSTTLTIKIEGIDTAHLTGF